ncbi:MAG: ferritin [Candidatus Omnitrophota bacterium]
MISGKMAKAINRQINRELYSAYLYAGMAAHAASIGLKGFENWFLIQVEEETAHARRMYDYLNQNGAKVVLDSIETPPQEYSSPIDLFEKTLEHEKRVTKMINGLVILAGEEGDKNTENFLRWYVKEQMEEEEHAGGAIGKIKESIKKNDEKKGIVDIDAYFLKRKFTPPED